MKPKVLFSAPYDFLDLGRFEETLQIEKTEVWRLEDLTSTPAQAWVPNPGQHFVIDEPVLDMFPDLRLVATPSTGVNHIDREACRAREIQTLSLLDDRRAMNSISASAEFTFLLLLNALRRFDIGLTEAREGRWRSDESALRGRELQRRSVGLVGFGRIGRRLADYLRAFAASVTIFDPYVDVSGAGMTKVNDLREMFASCDAVIVCCALTEETTGLIDGRLLDQLPQNGILVNSSRGEVLDEPTICRVLRGRLDLMLSTDVLSGEVHGSHAESCLWELASSGQVVITPHMAGVTVDSQQKAAEAILNLVSLFFGD